MNRPVETAETIPFTESINNIEDKVKELDSLLSNPRSSSSNFGVSSDITTSSSSPIQDIKSTLLHPSNSNIQYDDFIMDGGGGSSVSARHSYRRMTSRTRRSHGRSRRTHSKSYLKASRRKATKHYRY